MRRHSLPQLCGWVYSDFVASSQILSPTSSLFYSFLFSSLLQLLPPLVSNMSAVVFQLTTHQELWTYIVTNLASVYIREGNRHQEVSPVITGHVFKSQQSNAISITAAAVDYFSKLWTNSNCKFITLATVHLFIMLLGCPTCGDCKINEIQAFTSWLLHFIFCGYFLWAKLRDIIISYKAS